MSAILVDYTFQTSSPFIDTAIKELLNLMNSANHSFTIACFNCSAVSNSHRNTLAVAGLHALQSTRFQFGLFAGHVAGSIKMTLRSGVWQCETARRPAAEARCLKSFQFYPCS